MNKNKFLSVVFCIILPLFLILFSYKTILFLTDLNLAQQNTVDFINNEAELKIDYSAKEISHLEDVQKVIKFMDYFFYLSLLIFTLILTNYKKNKKQIKKLLLYGGITTIALLVIILILSLINFDFIFNLFHEIFFPQGNWTFPADSLLIKTFPLEFFIEISRNVILSTLILGSIFILLNFIIKNDRKSRRT